MDDGDRAQHWEEREREAAIKAAVTHKGEDPLIIDDIIYCRGCRKPLDEQRLTVMPGATRCVPCQSIIEGIA